MADVRSYLRAILFFGIVGICFASPLRSEAATSKPISVGGYFVNSESVFNALTRTYFERFQLPAQRRVVVHFAPQYATDFGIIPALDLEKWKKNDPVNFPVRYLYRRTGQTDSRYLLLNAGYYCVVARDLSNIGYNRFAVKIRNVRNPAYDNGVYRDFIASKILSATVGPTNWNGFAFTKPAGYRAYFDGVFSRGIGGNVQYYILSPTEYQRFTFGQTFTPLYTGSDPKTMATDLRIPAGTYYFIVVNQEGTFSSFTVTRELYK